MQSPRETITDSLSAIIQIIHLGYQSGTLTVERGEGKTREEGVIVFSNGRVIEARVGQYSGMAAFNILNAWQACRFSFVNGTQPLLQKPPSSPDPIKRISSSHLPETQIYPSDTYYKQSLLPATLPVRLPSGEAALQHPESFPIPRVHRRLLLLINGQRTVDELARLLLRSPEETQSLLRDLEQAGLTRQ